MATKEISGSPTEIDNGPQRNDLSPIDVGNSDKDEINPDDINVIQMESTVLNVDTTDKRTRRVTGGDYTFAAKKTVAQGMMDVALITANANQLRYLIEYQRQSPTFLMIVIFIVISLLLQIAVGVSLIFKGRFDMKGMSKSPKAKRINNYMVAGIFLITIINVFIAAFSVGGTS